MSKWRERIHVAITITKVGLFFIAPDSLESKWLTYEYGYATALLAAKPVVPVLVGVAQAFVNARLPMFEALHASTFGAADAFASLCATCAKHLGESRSDAQIDRAARTIWQNRVGWIADVLKRAQQVIPFQYTDVAPYARQQQSRFNMPEVLEHCETELFMIGPNHFYTLNLTGGAPRFHKLLDWLMASDSRSAHFLLSDMWNTSVFDCYKLFLAQGTADLELAAFTESWKTTTSTSYVDHVITRHLGAAALQKIKQEQKLQLRVLPTIFDNLWFTDPKAPHGRCQLALFNTLSPDQRPFFHAKAGSELFVHYRSLAENGFTYAQPLWPPT